MISATVISGPLQDEREENGRRVLLRELIVSLNGSLPTLKGIKGIRVLKRHTMITIPKGFDTDYSSIPWFALSIMGPWQDHDIAGVVHDYLYKKQAPRKVADQIWRITASSGKRHVGPIRGFLGYLGLRVGGWKAYNSYKKRGF